MEEFMTPKNRALVAKKGHLSILSIDRKEKIHPKIILKIQEIQEIQMIQMIRMIRTILTNT